MSPRHWLEIGNISHPTCSTTRQYQKPVGKRTRDWMASYDVERGGEGRQNPISSLLKMTHHRADYCTTSRTGIRQREQVSQIPEKLSGGIIESHQRWKAMTVSKHDDGMILIRFEGGNVAWERWYRQWGRHKLVIKWRGGGLASMLASFTCIPTCCHASGWLVGGLGGMLERSSCRVTVRRSSSRARVSCSKRASCSLTEAKMLAAEWPS